MSNPVSRYMTTSPVVISHEATLQDAEEQMAKHKIRHLPVIEENRLVGVVSHRDIEVALAIYDTGRFPVSHVMSRAVHTVSLEAPLEQALLTMAKHKAGSIVVVDRHEKPVGIFTSIDAMTLLSRVLDDESNPVDLTNCSWPTS